MPKDKAPGGVTRRSVLSFLVGVPTTPAVSTPAPRRSYDDAVFFLAGRLAADIAGTDSAGAIDENALLVRVNKCVQAMTLFPASDPEAISAKLDAAAWSLDRGYYRVTLADTLSADLIASAERDRAKVS
jgi:hypothetical protein